MLSHDNMLSAMKQTLIDLRENLDFEEEGERFVSYLPLSHSAAQCTDLVLPLLGKATTTFARPDALQGSLVETLKEVRPTLFFSVPRVWEKIEEKMKALGASTPAVVQKISGWAKSVGEQKTLAIASHWPSKKVLDANPDIPRVQPSHPYGTYTLAHFLILGNIKKALGLD